MFDCSVRLEPRHDSCAPYRLPARTRTRLRLCQVNERAVKVNLTNKQPIQRFASNGCYFSSNESLYASVNKIDFRIAFAIGTLAAIKTFQVKSTPNFIPLHGKQS